MPVEWTVTNLRTKADPPTGTVWVGWDNPDGALTQTRISVSLDDGATWTDHYLDPVITERVLWDVCVNQPYLVRVTALAGTDESDAHPVAGDILGYCGGTFGMWLTSMDDQSLNAPIGGTENEDQGWAVMTNPTLLNRAGRAKPRVFFDTAEGEQYDFDLMIPPYVRINSGGTVLTYLQIVEMLRSMAHFKDTLRYKDDDGYVRYCKMTNFQPKRFHTLFRHIQGSLIEIDRVDEGYPYPLTTAP